MKEFLKQVKFNEAGLVEAIIQDDVSGEVLMLAHMNRESLQETIASGRTHFWSRSRNRLWLKGETSGNYQEVKEIKLDCDGDALLVKVEQRGVACHSGERSCFFRRIEGKQLTEMEEEPVRVGETSAAILESVFEVILDRKRNPRQGSYTCRLFDRGREEILRKIGEEASEVIIGSMEGDSSQVTWEVADVIYHLLVLLGFHDIPLKAVFAELWRRHKSQREQHTGPGGEV